MNEHVSPNNSYSKPVWLSKHALNGAPEKPRPCLTGAEGTQGPGLCPDKPNLVHSVHAQD